MAEADLAMLARWLNEPHVASWWREPSGLEAVRAEYLPAIAGTEPCRCYIVGRRGVDVGMVQTYSWAGYPKEATGR